MTELAGLAGFFGLLVGGVSRLVSHFPLYERVPHLGQVDPPFFGPLLSIVVLVLARRDPVRWNERSTT